IRGHGWAPIRRPLSVMLITSSIAMVATVGIVVWSHHFGSSPLNSGLWPYKAAGITWGILVVSAIAAGAGAIVAVVSRLETSPRTSRALGILALLMAVVLVVVFAGMLTWWISLAIHAPWFFGSGIVGDFGCHTGNLMFRALRLDQLWNPPPGARAKQNVIRVEAKPSEVDQEGYPSSMVAVVDLPARGELPPVK